MTFSVHLQHSSLSQEKEIERKFLQEIELLYKTEVLIYRPTNLLHRPSSPLVPPRFQRECSKILVTFSKVNVVSNIKLAIFFNISFFFFSSCPHSSVFECEQEKNGFFAKHLLMNITDEHRDKSIEEVLLAVSCGELFRNCRKLHFA